MDIDKNFDKSSQEKLVQERYQIFEKLVRDLVQKYTPANRMLMVISNQKNTLECASECFEVKEHEVLEAQSCQDKCEKSIKFVDFKTQVAFARFDSLLNGCLHSCTKQRRKSAELSGDVANCYNDCFNSGKLMLEDLDIHLGALYSRFSDSETNLISNFKSI